MTTVGDYVNVNSGESESFEPGLKRRIKHRFFSGERYGGYMFLSNDIFLSDGKYCMKIWHSNDLSEEVPIEELLGDVEMADFYSPGEGIPIPIP